MQSNAGRQTRECAELDEQGGRKGQQARKRQGGGGCSMLGGNPKGNGADGAPQGHRISLPVWGLPPQEAPGGLQPEGICYGALWQGSTPCDPP